MTVRVLLADDHPLFRDGIASLLETHNYEVVGQAANGREALRLAEELQPDLILMDIRMAGITGLAATRLIKAKHPDMRIVILTVSEDDADLFEAIKSGAAGYLQKSLDSDQFFALLEAVMRGEVGLNPVLAGKILREFAQPAADREPSVDDLTPREHEVLALVARGATNTEIATTLTISENTVKFHMKNILQKLQARNRAEVVAFALRSGLID
ncbi:MAG: response regulator transcription factor [Anaerolineae bacterium]|nr:response regulator transcription factor [Anaerolineae bacterium]